VAGQGPGEGEHLLLAAGEQAGFAPQVVAELGEQFE